MKPLTIVFFGRSGSGKTTQANKLIEYIESHRKTKVLYFETGEGFRSFIKTDGYISSLVKKSLDKGGLLPAFLPIWVWADFFIKNLKKENDLILDGICRQKSEAPVFDEAMKFIERGNIYIFLINTSKDWSRKRLLERGRYDDVDSDSLESRLSWFDSKVLPVLEFFKHNKDYHYAEIDGEKTIDEVHEEIICQIDWKNNDTA